MSLFYKKLPKSICLSLALIGMPALADTAADINAVIQQNLTHTQNEDLDAMMSTVHSQSPSYMPTRQAIGQLFPVFDLKYEILEYRFIAEDDEYAYAKIKQLTTKVAGPAFNNNEIEALQIFKKENGHWKLWTQANLQIKFVN